MGQKAYQKLIAIDEFSDKEWEEIVSLGFEPFEIEHGDKLTRGQWWAVMEMAIGKANLIENGLYGGDDSERVNDSDWADELRAIADVILTHL
jgi:hypothetical protein